MSRNLTLVTEHQPAAAIFWWRKSDAPVVPFAASELLRYLRKMSGATLPVSELTIDPTAVAASGIVIETGAGERARDFTSAEVPAEMIASIEAQLRAEQGDAFVIRSCGERIVLTGTNDRSVLYAAYRLLEHLGVRFFAPDFPFYQGHAERVPSEASLQVTPLHIMETASFNHRRKYVEEGWSHTPETLTQLLEWMAKQRLNVLVYPYDYEGLGTVTWDLWRDQLIPELSKRGIILQVGGHGYQSFLPSGRYQDAHPEWFPAPKDPAGIGVGTGPANVFHVDNDAALQTYIDNVIDYLKARPEIGVFEAWPPDTARWPARAIDHFGSTPNAQAYVTNALSAAVRQALPDVVVEVISYIPATDPPDRAYMYDDATVVDIAPFDRSYSAPLFRSSDSLNRHYDQLMKRWRDSGFRGDMGIYEYYRKYSWHSLPIILPRLIGEEIPYFRSLGANGLGIYSEPADWLTYELTHLLVAALSWNTGIQADDYVETYLSDRYCSAAREMRTYLDIVEEAGRLLFDRAFGNYDSLEVMTKVRDGYRRALDLLETAKARVDVDEAPSFVMERLGWNLEFAIADTEIDYFRIQNEPEKEMDTRNRARSLAETHCFDGIVLQCTALARRYDSGVTRHNTLAIYDRYRQRW